MKSFQIEKIINKLNLEPLPGEGGYFRQTYIDASSSTILYLITRDNFSALHRLKYCEIFHFYAGTPVEVVQFDDTGVLKKTTLGSDIMNHISPQVVVPTLTWQGTRLINEGKEGDWALLGTTMAPPFEFKDFELGDREKLINQFPSLTDVIRLFTRQK